MTLQDKSDKTIQKLLALTQDHLIKWRKITDTRSITFGTNDVVDLAYQAEYKGSNFVIYEDRYQTMDELERTYWDSQVNVDLVDDDGVLIWRLPRNTAMRDLLEAVRIRAGNVEEKLDDFLKD